MNVVKDDAKVPAIANGAPIDIYSKIEGADPKQWPLHGVDLGHLLFSGTYPGEFFCYEIALLILQQYDQQRWKRPGGYG